MKTCTAVIVSVGDIPRFDELSRAQCEKCGVRDEHLTRSCPMSKKCFTCGMTGHINKVHIYWIILFEVDSYMRVIRIVQIDTTGNMVLGARGVGQGNM
jgi:hypothetical protein